jgi:hypothetical protein
MTSKVYKTASGKTLDMGSLVLKNEQVRAVGNMNVNARGDVINDDNIVISSRGAQVNRQYNDQVQKSKGQQ